MAPALCFAAALEHIGKLNPELVPSERAQTEELIPATPAERLAIPVQLSAEDQVFAGKTFLTKKQDLKLVLVEPAHGDPYLFADVNLNGAFEAGERFSFDASKRRTALNFPQVILKVQLSLGPYAFYPVRILLPENRIYKMNHDGKGGRVLLRSASAFVEGIVEIGGVPVSARYEFDSSKGAAYADFGWLGMDCNGDGWIDESANQEEFTYAKDESIMFHVNSRDVSTVRLDLKSGTFTVREHPAGDNKRIPLRVGDVVPDFAFTDLDGKSHRFSEFRGKYVLLDFWGTWCGSCRKELPDLEKAYQQFRSRGFVIMGMGDDKETEKARKVVSDAGVTYPQSSGETGNDLVYKRFRIDRFPTKVLLNPEGKVIASDSDGAFQPEHIAVSLDKLLPAPQ